MKHQCVLAVEPVLDTLSFRVVYTDPHTHVRRTLAFYRDGKYDILPQYNTLFWQAMKEADDRRVVLRLLCDKRAFLEPPLFQWSDIVRPVRHGLNFLIPY